MKFTALRLFPLVLLCISSMVATALAPNSWQKRLDKALLDVDGASNPSSRFRLIQRAVQDPTFREDVTKGIDAIQKDGFGKGHPTLIEALWPKGTIARSDIEGIQALVKSLPERRDEIFESDTSLANVIQSTAQSFQFQYVSKAAQKAFQNREQSLTLAQNVFRRDPKNVETLDSTKLATIESDDNDSIVEIRQFDAFDMVACDLASPDDYTLVNMGDSLAKLSSYVLGYNSEEQTSCMTTPFVMQKSAMWLKLPSDMVDVEPSDASVYIEKRQSETLALLEFSGICTNAEVERQKNTLLEALDNDEWTIADDSVFVFQYNAPGTLPWRRKNEVGFLLEPDCKLTSVDVDTVTSESSEEIPLSLDAQETASEVVAANENTTTMEEFEEEGSEEAATLSLPKEDSVRSNENDTIDTDEQLDE